MVATWAASLGAVAAVPAELSSAALTSTQDVASNILRSAITTNVTSTRLGGVLLGLNSVSQQVATLQSSRIISTHNASSYPSNILSLLGTYGALQVLSSLSENLRMRPF